MDGQTDRKTNRWMSRQMDGQTDRKTNRWESEEGDGENGKTGRNNLPHPRLWYLVSIANGHHCDLKQKP